MPPDVKYSDYRLALKPNSTINVENISSVIVEIETGIRLCTRKQKIFPRDNQSQISLNQIAHAFENSKLDVSASSIAKYRKVESETKLSIDSVNT